MSVIIFGSGPLPCEPNYPITAPGARTWQILRTVACGLAKTGSNAEIIAIGLDETPRSSVLESTFTDTIQQSGCEFSITYYPLPYERFVQTGTASSAITFPADIRAVIATGSVQAYATAAAFAKIHALPLWVDVFGDPIIETQSQQEVLSSSIDEQATQLVHVWKLYVDGLLGGDQFSTLTKRQRYALLGQLGCTGRLNQHTASESLVHVIPYALFAEDLQPVQPPPTAPIDDAFTIMWSGSFNTWMDVPTLTKGLTDALRSNPQIKLLVVGGSIPGYNDISYGQFIDGIRAAGVEGAVTLMDWQPLSALPQLYARCNLGISIDRPTYEAELGSRTRLVNFLAAGLPIASTVVTELSQELVEAGLLLPFEIGDPESLTETILTACSLGSALHTKGLKGRQWVETKCNGERLGNSLADWISSPQRAADDSAKSTGSDTNKLTLHTQHLRDSLN